MICLSDARKRKTVSSWDICACSDEDRDILITLGSYGKESLGKTDPFA